ncbi:MAG: hypothetical protein OQK82_07515 [Candidatus Pacearchaeota archaeon]|nr:hypothetical protein [Candidatus Pacearchaeota archaeon]
MVKEDSKKERNEEEKIKKGKVDKKKSEEVKKSGEDTSKLEKDLKDVDIDKEKFRDVFIDINDDSPSLKQVAITPKVRTTLETSLAGVSVEKKDEDKVRYNVVNYEGDNKKTYDENMKQNDENLIMKSTLSRVRGDEWEIPEQKNNINFNVNSELEGMKKSYEEGIRGNMPVNDFEEFKTHDPFQRQKKKDVFYEFR